MIGISPKISWLRTGKSEKENFQFDARDVDDYNDFSLSDEKATGKSEQIASSIISFK